MSALDRAPLLEASVLAELQDSRDGTDLERDSLLSELRRCDSDELDRLMNLGNARLLRGQVEHLRDNVSSALRELDYEIRAPRRPQENTLTVKGVRSSDKTSITIRLAPQAEELETDLSGFSDGLCVRLRRQFEDQLWRRGIKLRTVSSERHDKVEGGCLTREADIVLADVPAQSETRRRRAKRAPSRNRVKV